LLGIKATGGFDEDKVENVKKA